MTEMTPVEGGQLEVNPQQQWIDYARSLISHYCTHGRYTGPQVQLHVRPMFALDETRILQAPFRQFSFFGVGDGTVPDAMIGAAGAVASGNLAIMAGSAIGNMIAGSRAKKAAVPQWHELQSGELVLTEHGFYVLHPGEPPITLEWDDILSGQLTGWDSFEMDVAEQGKYALVTPAATAIFGFWSLTVYPQHPQLQTLLQG